MAGIVKTNELPVINDLTGATIIGLDKNGVDAQFNLDKIVRSEKPVAFPATNPAVDGQGNPVARFAGETWPVDTSSYGSVFPGFGNITVPVKEGELYVANARFVWNAGAWKLQRELQANPFTADYAKKADAMLRASFVKTDVSASIVASWVAGTQWGGNPGTPSTDAAKKRSVTLLDAANGDTVWLKGITQSVQSSYTLASIYDATNTRIQSVNSQNGLTADGEWYKFTITGLAGTGPYRIGFNLLAAEDTTTVIVSKTKIENTDRVKTAALEADAQTGIITAAATKDNFDFLAYLNANTSILFAGGTVQAPADYVLDAVGDYLEFTGISKRASTDSAAQSLYLFGKTGNAQNYFGFYNDNEIRVRSNTNSSLSWILPSGVSNSAFNKIKLQVAATGWELFINDVSMGVVTKYSPLYINNIGDANNGATGANLAKAGIKSVTLSIGGAVVRSLDAAGIKALSSTVGEIAVIKQAAAAVLYPDIFVSYVKSYTGDPDNDYGLKNQPVFTVFTKIKNNIYCGFTLGKYTKTGINANMFRIGVSRLYAYNANANTMPSYNSQTVLSDGASDSVWKEVGAASETGSWHGNETLVRARFFMDGFDIGDYLTIADFTLKACSSFQFIQYSNLYNAGNMVCNRTMQVVFSPNGYLQRGGFRFLVNKELSSLYMGMFSIYQDLMEYATNEFGEQRQLDHASANAQTGYLAQPVTRRIEYENRTKGFYVHCTARVDDSEIDGQSFAFIKDNNQQCKYYRNSVPQNGTLQVTVGKVVNGTSEFRLYMR